MTWLRVLVRRWSDSAAGKKDKMKKALTSWPVAVTAVWRPIIRPCLNSSNIYARVKYGCISKIPRRDSDSEKIGPSPEFLLKFTLKIQERDLREHTLAAPGY